MTVAGRVCGVAGVAAIRSGQTVIMRWVAFYEMALRNAVKGKEQLIEVIAFKRGACRFYKCFYVTGFLVIGR